MRCRLLLPLRTPLPSNKLPAACSPFLPQAGLIQFKDLNTDKSAFQRTYANQARHCARRASPLAQAGRR